MKVYKAYLEPISICTQRMYGLGCGLMLYVYMLTVYVSAEAFVNIYKHVNINAFIDTYL